MPVGVLNLMAVALHSGHHATIASSGWALAIAGAVVGFIVGMTGMGGGALMTPILVLLFGITPSAAVSSDLLASLVMRPLGGAVHLRRGTVNWRMVKWLAIGSVPAAFSGVFIIKAFGSNKQLQHDLTLLLGWALLVASVAMLAKAVLQGREARRLADAGERPNTQPHRIKPLPTLIVGVVGGVIVGMTSVGSGSLMIVLLMLLYPRLSAKTMVGTDLIQAIPLVGAATLAHLFFGDVSFSLAAALIAGSLPGVLVGARLSSRAPEGIVRPALIFVLAASALKLLGLDTRTLGYTLAIIAVTALPLWGAIDATIRREAAWDRAGHSRTFWVGLQGIGAPFGVGLIASMVYAFRIRSRVVTAAAEQLAGEGATSGHPLEVALA
jgi:uncharacterized membrane protein YfcA